MKGLFSYVDVVSWRSDVTRIREYQLPIDFCGDGTQCDKEEVEQWYMEGDWLAR